MELSKLLPNQLLKEIYRDLAKPGMQNVGKAIGGILGLGNTILLPIHLLNERANMIATRNLENFRKRIQRDPPENIQEPAPEIAVPIIERLAYVSDTHVAALYVELLASACRVNSAACAHPSFVKIIEVLTPDEALILKFLAKREVVGYETLTAGTYHRRYRVTAFPKRLRLTFPDKATLYCENLEGLGIIEDRKSQLRLEIHYRDVKAVTDPILREWQERQPSVSFSRIRGHFHLSRLGAELVIACGHNQPKIVTSLRRFWN